MINFKITIDSGVIEQNILSEFRSHMENALSGAIPFIRSKVERVIKEALTNSDAWQSIKGGYLSQLLLIPFPDAALNDILRTVVDEIVINRTSVTISGKRVIGSFDIKVLNDDYRSVLNIPQGTYITTNGISIPWLSWLLLDGTEPLFIKAKLLQTRKGITLVSDDDNLAIPSAYAGIKDDNFLTRTLNPLESVIGKIIEDEVSRRT